MEYYKIKADGGNIAVDDTILVKDMEACAGSRILEGFKPLFSAEAVTRLENKGYKISGKTHVGEFGLDLVGEFSYYGEKSDELKGALAELVLEIAFSPIGYRILKRWRAYAVGKDYLSYIGKESEV